MSKRRRTRESRLGKVRQKDQWLHALIIAEWPQTKRSATGFLPPRIIEKLAISIEEKCSQLAANPPTFPALNRGRWIQISP
ncbi:hypothetical protein RBWH47_05803 [Rhodopirellula baltica WH47]|uniref:Uncharacterized protein n=1 Tax=Rhodopirellula baltica WH47 TaxID=991778 RepID=F2AZ68_RHOBT|nr:hypothetical protein RBWH47_05803 [Rhodopirellula baltica WH47]